MCEAGNGDAYRVDTVHDSLTCEDVIDEWFFTHNGCGQDVDGRDLSHWKGQCDTDFIVKGFETWEKSRLPDQKLLAFPYRNMIGRPQIQVGSDIIYQIYYIK